MKQALFWAIAFFVFAASVDDAFAEKPKCENPEWFYDFPNGWTLAWERKISTQRNGIATDALVVGEYHFRDGGIAEYYRTDHPDSMGAEAVFIVGPADFNYVTNDGRSFKVSEVNFFFRHLLTRECWHKVEKFNLEVRINTDTKDLEYSLYYVEFAGDMPAL